MKAKISVFVAACAVVWTFGLSALANVGDEAMVEVRPGNPTTGAPFWNVNSASFMYPPAFDFAQLPGKLDHWGPDWQTVKYRFTLFCADGRARTFDAAEPWASLKPVWADVPTGPVTLTCEGINPKGVTTGLSGMRSFWRTAPFRADAARPAAKRSYGEALRRAIDYVFRAPELSAFAAGQPVPPKQQALNGYPSKTFSAAIQAMVRAAESMPERREKALQIARLSGEWLLKNSQPADAPLAFWPETYASDTNQACWCPDLRGRIMLLYPASVGRAYLKLAAATGERRWIDAAERIAETYVKVRRKDGTWALVMEIATGRELCPNTLVPDGLMAFFEELHRATGAARWRTLADECFAWVEAGPLKDWNWEGQFEDTKPRPPYGNLCHGNAMTIMRHILRRYPGDPAKLALARELIRYAEDQFVHWERPCLPDGRSLRFAGTRYWRGTAPTWHVPAVVEQYDCYVPVDGSVSGLILSFLAIGEASGNPADFAKARALGDQMVNMQLEDGHIPTFWRGDDRGLWLNCHIFDTEALQALSKTGPRVWTSLSSVKSVADFERIADDLVGHGVDVAQANAGWTEEMRTAFLKICRAKGLRLFLELPEGSRCDRAKRTELNREMAVMIGGCYKGLAIDRNLYSFTPGRHRIVIEPPVYSRTQAYLKFPHYMMRGDGHYYGQYVPTGRAEIVVPEKLFDGRQHLKIIPVAVKRAPADAVVENDTVVSGRLTPTDDLRNRCLVELEFDLTGLEKCRLDKVGIAVYWRMENENPAFNPMRGCYSLFAESTRAAMKRFAETEVERWKAANGGEFPSDVIIAARLGDEVFNHTGWLNSEAVSLPLWGFSDSALKVWSTVFTDGETYPRTWGAGEVYGEECAAKFLYAFHAAAARYLRDTVDYLHAHGVKCFRNTTRGDCWSYVNDHDGTGQEVLAGALDYLHLDPYPYHGKYSDDTIPFDMAYMKGLSRRCAKPMIVWMQAHEFGAGGLQHPDPATISRMYEQVKRHEPESIMWLGYTGDAKNRNSTFPFNRPDSWARAGEVHADFHRMTAKPSERPPLAVVRPYRARAAVANPQGADKDSPDVLLGSFVRRWSCRHDLPYDVFEVPPQAFRSEADGAKLAEELKAYRFVVSSSDFPGAVNITATKDGRRADRGIVWKLADDLAAQAVKK